MSAENARLYRSAAYADLRSRGEQGDTEAWRLYLLHLAESDDREALLDYVAQGSRGAARRLTLHLARLGDAEGLRRLGRMGVTHAHLGLMKIAQQDGDVQSILAEMNTGNHHHLDLAVLEKELTRSGDLDGARRLRAYGLTASGSVATAADWQAVLPPFRDRAREGR